MVSIPHPYITILWSCDYQMSPRMPFKPLQNQTCKLHYETNHQIVRNRFSWMRSEYLTSKPDPEPSRVSLRVCVAVFHTFICPSKLPQANKFPSELKATVPTVSLCPVLREVFSWYGLFTVYAGMLWEKNTALAGKISRTSRLLS